MLLYDYRRQASGPKEALQGAEQILHDNWRQALGRLIEKQDFRIEYQSARYRQHLLLAAGKLTPEIMLSPGQGRKQL